MEYKKLSFRSYVRANENIRMMTEEITGYHPAHTHDDFIEIAYIDAGSGEQVISDTVLPISEGDLFLFNPLIVHSFKADPDRPLRVTNCIFQPEMLGLSPDSCRDFLDVAYHYLFFSLRDPNDPQNFLRLSGLSGTPISGLLREMQQEYDDRKNGFMQILKSDLTKLMILIFRYYKTDTHQKQHPAVYQKRIVQETVSYLENHYRESLSCEDLAERAYLSVNYFRAVFKSITGTTIIGMLQRIRIKQACRLLVETDLSVSEIGEAVGYRDTKFFARLFKEQTGMSPGRWRQANTVESPPKIG
ncbi:MAG: helix-turn-helix domain-containing protein [Eubacteriales bacterium]